MLLEYSCENGGHYPVMDEKMIIGENANDEKKINCEFDKKRILWLEEPVDMPYWKIFIWGYHGMYRVYDVLYENELGKTTKLFTYKFPFTYGLDVLAENTFFLIEESHDLIKIYYDRKPVDGFIIDNNPFSKRIIFQYMSNLDDVERKDHMCYYR